MLRRLQLTSIATVMVAALLVVAIVASSESTATSTASPVGWRRVFTDNFTKPVALGRFPRVVNGAWGHSYTNGLRDTSGNGTYEPSRVVSQQRGILNIHVHTAGGLHMVAAAIPTIRGAHGSEGGLLYGRYSIRLRADAVPGYKLGVLLWPDNEIWPGSGELDFPEVDLRSWVHGYVHPMGGGPQVQFYTKTLLRRWHTYTIIWLPDVISYWVDGHCIGVDRHQVPSTPMHLVIQAETQTQGGTPPSNASGNVQVNWLTIDTPACNASMSTSGSRAGCLK